jgi:tRNA G37 N-methylase Trm5
MFFGPVVVPDSVAKISNEINEDSVVLELGSGVGMYSVAIRKKTLKLMCIEPDARLIDCMIVNTGTERVECTVCNAWVTDRSMIILNDMLVETDGNHHKEDEIRLIKLSELMESFPFEFTHIVAHSKNYFDTFATDYPEIVKSCTVLKSYEC